MAETQIDTGRSERRRHRRNQTFLVATVNYGRTLLPCFIADISMAGAKIKLLEPGKLPRGDTVLESKRFGQIFAELIWQKGQFAGLRFAAERQIDLTPAEAVSPAR